ncbi:MAG: response regulator [Candidatus Acidiferrales bacterium]
MRPLRVFVVDDSLVVRKIVCDTLAEDPALMIAGSASDGRSALGKLPQMNADLVTLDIEMEGMSGLETLVEIRKVYPKLPVIMYSTLTERGATATLEALSLGASDYATKPDRATSPAEARENIRAELIPKIKSLCRVGAERRVAPRPSAFSLAEKIVRPSRRRIEIVAIGTSTGGPRALSEVLPSIPHDFPVPIVIVQHMPPVVYTAAGGAIVFAERDYGFGGERGSGAGTRARVDCAGKFPYDDGPRGKSSSAAFESRAAGKFVSAFGGCFVSFGGAGVWIGSAGGGDDWNGERRSEGSGADTQCGRGSDRAG